MQRIASRPLRRRTAESVPMLRRCTNASHNRYMRVSVSLHNANAKGVMKRITRAATLKFHTDIPNPDDDLWSGLWPNRFAKCRGTVLSKRPRGSGVQKSLLQCVIGGTTNED